MDTPLTPEQVREARRRFVESCTDALLARYVMELERRAEAMADALETLKELHGYTSAALRGYRALFPKTEDGQNG